jgi:hypothetical protein
LVTYAFEKLYADLVTDDGTVCIVYLTWTEILGLRHATAGYELYTPDGKREVVHARRAPARPDLDSGAWTVRLDVPGGPFELCHSARSGAWAPIGGPTSLSWSVKTARADVEARWLGDEPRALRGRGYADWVTLHRVTRRLGLRRVNWGRAHVGEATIIWNCIESQSGEVWSCALSTDGARRDESRDLELGGPGPGRVPRGLELGDGRVLHDGPALDRERVPSATLRGLVKLVNPPVTETRWVSRARLGGGLETGWALHEHVRFGKDGGVA